MGFGGGIFLTIANIALLVFLVIELGLTAYLVHKTPDPFGWGGDSSRFNFMLFNSVWSFFTLIYTAIFAAFISSLFYPLAALVITVVTAIFWFSGSTALAALIGTPDCYGNHYCHVAVAAVTFGYFIWAIFTGLAIMAGLSAAGSGGSRVRADTTKPPMRPYSGA